MQNSIIVITIFALAVLGSCGPKTQRKDAASDGQKQSELTTNQEQARLWKEANKQGLEKIPQPENPVQLRQQPGVANTAIQTKAQPLPQGLQGGISVIALPQLGDADAKAFANSVRVRSVEGERIELDVGGQGVLSFYARARGGPLRAGSGEEARLDLRYRDDPFNRQQILALRMANGDGIVSALDTGDKPITLTIPLFQLIARQLRPTERYHMDVEVSVSGETQTLKPGQLAEFRKAGITVGIVGSDVFTGEGANAVEGPPYALNIVAWPTQ